MESALVSQLALELIPGIGSRGIKHLVSYCGSSTEVFQAKKNQLLKIPGVGEKMANQILNYKPYNEAEQILNEANRIGTRVLHFNDPEFPSRLRRAPDSPTILFVGGKGSLNPRRTIAVVGTRKATGYGKEITDQLVADLANLDATIISGLAYGIDIQAHKKAIQSKIPTFAVLAGGLDRIYPSAHKKYAMEMQESGGIISESIPGTRPSPKLFPARNRIIAGMSDAVIVVEAAEKGGALITAQQADSYDRYVFAVPGNVGNQYSQGTNKLIVTQKALIYTGIEDLIYHLGWKIDPIKKDPIPTPNLTLEEETIFTLLLDKRQALAIDSIAIQSQLSTHVVASNLLSLEFKNLIKSLPGKRYTATSQGFV